MDQKLQPGIRIDSVLVTESHFKRLQRVPQLLEYRNEIQTGFSLSPDKKTLGVMFTCDSSTTEKEVVVGVTYFAQFSKIEGQENFTYKEYINSGAPQAMLYAYAREHLQDLTLKGGVPPLILNPFNTVPETPVELDV